METKITPFGKSKPRTFRANSVVREKYFFDDKVGDYVYIELPRKIRKEYQKGINSEYLDLSVHGMKHPSIKLGELGYGAKSGDLYEISIQPVKYHDNGGTYYWRSDCVINALDGGYVPSEKTSCLIGSGFYVTDKNGKESKSHEYDSGIGFFGWFIIGILSFLIFLTIQ